MFVPEIDGKEMRMSFIAPPPLLPRPTHSATQWPSRTVKPEIISPNRQPAGESVPDRVKSIKSSL